MMFSNNDEDSKLVNRPEIWAKENTSSARLLAEKIQQYVYFNHNGNQNEIIVWLESLIQAELEKAKKQGDILLPIDKDSILGEELLRRAKKEGYEKAKKESWIHSHNRDKEWEKELAEAKKEAYLDAAEIVDSLSNGCAYEYIEDPAAKLREKAGE